RTLVTGVSVPSTSSKLQYVEVDITAAVKDWLDNMNGAGGQYNNGIAIKPTRGSSISATFSSKEDTTYSHDPELNIVWQPSAGQIVGQIGPSQVSSGTYAINISGNAANATLANALSNLSPTQCPGGQFASGITNTGNVALCAAPSASGLSGTVLVANGGTGATTPLAALTNLGAASSTALASETTRAQGAELTLQNNINSEAATRASADTALQSNISAESTRAQAAEATKADLVKPVQIVTSLPSGACTTSNAMVLYSNGPAGQQLYICRQDLNTEQLAWAAANDETSLQQQISSLQSTSATALTAETNARIAGDQTLTTNLNNEIGRAQAADTTLQTNIDAETSARTAAVTNEAAARTAGDAALAMSVSNEATTRAAGDATLTNNLAGEVTRATGAEATKADLVKPVQSVASLAAVPCSLDAMVLLQGAPVGQQLYVCRLDSNSNSNVWAQVNDERATVAGDKAYTDAQVAAEASSRAAADTT